MAGMVVAEARPPLARYLMCKRIILIVTHAQEQAPVEDVIKDVDLSLSGRSRDKLLHVGKVRVLRELETHHII